MFYTTHLNLCDYIDGDAFESLRVPGLGYCKTDLLHGNAEVPATPKALLSHNSSLAVTPEFAATVFARYPTVKNWYVPNVAFKPDKTARCPRLHAVPVGLERVRWFPTLMKRQQMYTTLQRYDTLVPTELCLANFSLATNTPERTACLQAASSFATLQVLPTVQQARFSDYTSFLLEILHHKFVLCPNGSGYDTHRLWEVLYMGRIPVVTHSAVADAFLSLPMLVLPSWEHLSVKVLQEYWDKFVSGEVFYSLDMLRFGYWADRIAAAVRSPTP
jgi:hypothetical protein